MKRILSYIGAVLFTIIPFATVSAETITHNFNDMYYADPRTLILSSGNTVGTTPEDIIYTCGGNATAKFWNDHVFGTKISAQLLDYGAYLIISPAIENLTEIAITFEPTSEVRDNLKVYISEDGSNWGTALSGDAISYTKGMIRATFPAGNYYIRIFDNNGSYDASILHISYTKENCNCFRYIPE